MGIKKLHIDFNLQKHVFHVLVDSWREEIAKWFLSSM